MERLIKSATIAVFGALAFSACEVDTRPVVITDNSNVIIDMPAGVRWDVVGMTYDDCLHSGGEWVVGICEGIDF